MSDETAPAPEADATVEKPKTKTKAKAKRRRGNRAPRKPTFKDWLRVIKSQGNTCPNATIHLIVNKANGVCTLVTNAPAKVDDDGNPVGDAMEGERRQIFNVTSHEVIDVPDPEPEPAPAPPAETAAK